MVSFEIANFPRHPSVRARLTPGTVFCTYTKGDEFYGTLIYVVSVGDDDHITLCFADDGCVDTFSFDELPSVELATIRPYNADTDPDFIGMIG